MGKAYRGRRLGESETAIQLEALPDFFPAGYQADPTREGCRDPECESRSGLFDQTPSHEDFRGSPQGAGNQTWVTTLIQAILSGKRIMSNQRGDASKGLGNHSFLTIDYCDSE